MSAEIIANRILRRLDPKRVTFQMFTSGVRGEIIFFRYDDHSYKSVFNQGTDTVTVEPHHIGPDKPWGYAKEIEAILNEVKLE